jgi:hypothetical protein
MVFSRVVDEDGRAIELVRVDAVVKRGPRKLEASATLVPLIGPR